MSQSSDPIKSPGIKKGQDVASVGFVGGWLINYIQSWPTDPLNALLQKNLILGVPFFSICILEIVKWIWGVIGPQNADKIKLRFLLNKKQKVIENELKKPNLSEAHKKKLQEALEAVSLDRINSYDHKA